jgi:hypothetical protein
VAFASGGDYDDGPLSWAGNGSISGQTISPPYPALPRFSLVASEIRTMSCTVSLRRFCRFWIAAAWFVAFIIGLSTLEAAEIKFKQHEGGVTVEVDGKPFTEYQLKIGSKPILWPIVGPTGVEMTRAFPMKEVEGEKRDHPHQKSMWFTHGKVNDIDFWTEAANYKDGKAPHGKPIGTIKHREFLRVGDGVISTTNDWLGPDGKKQLEDQRTLTFRADDKTRTIDFDIVLKASNGDVTFGDTKEGSFGVRVPTVMDVNSKKGGQIVTSEGLIDKDAWGKPAKWVDYHGPMGGEVLGVAILNHPSSFRFPTTWHVRDYGLFAANPFGLHDFDPNAGVKGDHKIASGETMTFRYRVLFHVGDQKGAKVAEAFEAYAKEAK